MQWHKRNLAQTFNLDDTQAETDQRPRKHKDKT